MNSSWNKWVCSSIIEKFKTGLDSKSNYLWVIGEKLDTKMSQRFELRYVGPTFVAHPGEYECKVSLSLAVRSNLDQNYRFNHLDRVGLGQSVFTNCIKIFKFGPVSGVDDQTQFDHMRLNSEISTVNYGQLDLVDNVVISTIEADYIGEFRT